ncbi:ribokinase [Roseobacter sinensis]|uniref:Ribokinase n=1 Tax=Roseobacter sinensis TaxID=2931391 RepID=A0ABT3BGY8_9RHOB|nr:ribokinase [Roseobacter sp. WL0113]MCV3272846.1 ribokinase [Roseobacter sp. WL0113]
MNDIVVVGSINIDLTSHLPRWPQVGETITATRTEMGLGGKGANQAVAAARLGASVGLIGAVGADAFGQQALRTLGDANLTLAIETQAAAPTGLAVIDVGPDGDNTIRLSPGANATLTPETILRHAPLIAKSKVLLLQNETPLAASLRAARIARRHGVTVVMDPAPAPQLMWDRQTLEAFDILTPNAQEAALIAGAAPTGLQAAEMTASALTAMGPRGAIVTMGAAGVGWQIGTTSGRRPAPKVPTVDTVAAGDCFNGALAVFLAQGCPPDQAVELAVDAAALSTTRAGASVAAPQLSDLLAFRLEQAAPPVTTH